MSLIIACAFASGVSLCSLIDDLSAHGFTRYAIVYGGMFVATLYYAIAAGRALPTRLP